MGDYGVRVTQPGDDIFDVSIDRRDIALDSRHGSKSLKMSGSQTVSTTAHTADNDGSQRTTYSYDHNFGYYPQFDAYCEIGDNWYLVPQTNEFAAFTKTVPGYVDCVLSGVPSGGAIIVDCYVTTTQIVFRCAYYGKCQHGPPPYTYVYTYGVINIPIKYYLYMEEVELA